MTDHHPPFHYPAQLMGGAASKALAQARSGNVAAVFGSTFYAETDAGWLCVGGAGTAPSPLNLITAAPAGVDWSASGVRRGAAVRLSNGVIHIGGLYSFDISNAAEWVPDPLPGDWRVIDLERGLRTLRALAAHRVPEQGLGRIIIAGVPSLGSAGLVGAAQQPIAEAKRSLAAAFSDAEADACDLGWVDRLVGLGPGLTPSGDDVIAGMMIALHGLGETETGRRLWAQAQPHVSAAGNPISYAHLHAASRGEGGAAIHRLLNAIVAGSASAIRDCLNGIDRIGQTSGWDGTAGLVLVLDGWHRARRH